MTDAAFAKSLADARDELLYVARLRYNLTPMDAEDLVGQTTMRAWRYRRRYAVDYGCGMMPWLVNLLRWTALQQLRTKRRRLTYMTPADFGVDVDWIAELGAKDEIESRLCADETLVRILAELPECYREVLMLRAADESYENIAAMLDIPLGTVRSRLFRARERITEAMNGDGR